MSGRMPFLVAIRAQHPALPEFFFAANLGPRPDVMCDLQGGVDVVNFEAFPRAAELTWSVRREPRSSLATNPISLVIPLIFEAVSCGPIRAGIRIRGPGMAQI